VLFVCGLFVIGMLSKKLAVEGREKSNEKVGNIYSGFCVQFIATTGWKIYPMALL
jgi:hypothetical protein